jgi:hypothetical protein
MFFSHAFVHGSIFWCPKRFVAKHLSETFEKIKKGEQREIILTGLRHLLFLSHILFL